MEWNISPIRDRDGVITHFVSVQRDVTRAVAAEQFNRTLLNHLGEGVFALDREGRVTVINPEALRLLDVDAEADALGRKVHELVHVGAGVEGEQQHRAADCPLVAVLRTGEPLLRHQDRFCRRSGSFPVELSATAMRTDSSDVFAAVVVFHDISERKRRERELRRQANQDRLTGLMNRRFFDGLLERELAHAERAGEPLALIMLDLDHFKSVNDRLGHLCGDEVLTDLADLLADGLRGADTPVRWGGEEFAVLLPDTDDAGARVVAEAIRAAVARTDFGPAGRLTVSLGVAEYRAGDSPEALVARADAALYQAKRAGRDRVA